MKKIELATKVATTTSNRKLRQRRKDLRVNQN